MADRKVKSDGGVRDAYEFLDKLEVETRKVNLIMANPDDIKSAEAMIASWEPAKVMLLHCVTTFLSRV